MVSKTLLQPRVDRSEKGPPKLQPRRVHRLLLSLDEADEGAERSQQSKQLARPV
jgi:hypothetical protein